MSKVCLLISGPRFTISPEFKESLTFRVENFSLRYFTLISYRNNNPRVILLTIFTDLSWRKNTEILYL